MDPLSNYGPGGLGNEAHLGGMSGTMFPTSAGTSGSSPEGVVTWEPSGPSLGARLGSRIFGGSWGRVLKITTWSLRIGGAGAGFYFGGHYALPMTAKLGLGIDPNLKILACAGIGGVLGYIAPTSLRIFLPMLLFFGAIALGVWYFSSN